MPDVPAEPTDPDPGLDRLDPGVAVYHTAARLRSVIPPLNRLLRQQTGGPLTPTQGSVLGSIDRFGPIGLTDLAGREQLSLPMISKVVTLLEREGLVERLRDPDDGRAWRVQVSDHGQRWFAARRERRDRWLAEELGRLDDDDRRAVDAALPALERLVDAAS